MSPAALVKINHLHVLIKQEDGLWSARSLEIDYASCGKSLDRVKENFAWGLEETIKQHCRVDGNLDGLLKPSPPRVWAEFYKHREGHVLSLWTKFEVPEQAKDEFPFDALGFVEPVRDAA